MPQQKKQIDNKEKAILKTILKFVVFIALAVLNSCSLFYNQRIVLWTDQPEMAAYIENFNSNNDFYKVEIYYRSNAAASLSGTENQPDIVIGKRINSPELLSKFQPLDRLIGDEKIQPELFYRNLLSTGKADDKQLLLPLSFNLPGVVFKKDMDRKIPALMRVYHSLPQNVQDQLHITASEMVEGFSKKEVQKINTFEDQNIYCYYAAGIVGKLFIQLLYTRNYIDHDLLLKLHKHSKDLGLALQKVNIIKDIKEDILEIVLNLKQLRLKIFSDEEIKLELNVAGEKKIKARDITKNSDVEIINSDLVLANITDMAGSLNMEIYVNFGRGYCPVENIEDKKNIIGYIEMDAVYSPVLSAGIEVDNVRVGKMTNWDKLILNITTDGTMSYKEAFEQSAQILIEQFSALISEKEDKKKKSAEKKDDHRHGETGKNKKEDESDNSEAEEKEQNVNIKDQDEKTGKEADEKKKRGRPKKS